MTTWYRVFGKSQSPPDPKRLGEFVSEFRLPVKGTFFGAEEGWTRLELQLNNEEFAVTIERYLAEEEDIRQTFRTWAAWIESASEDPINEWLMEHMINTQQLLTIEPAAARASNPFVKNICTETARFLAQETEGVYEIDNQGFFDAKGKLLVPEEAADEANGET